MFILTATIAACLCAAAEIIFYNQKRTVGYCIVTVLRNIVAVDVLSMYVLRHFFKYRHFLDISTNLFSGKKTIYEEKGVKFVDKELTKGSKFANEQILTVEDLNSAASKGIAPKKKHHKP